MTVVDGSCALCGTYGPVRARMVAWLEPVFGPFENVDACLDEAACKARVAARGEPWPIREREEEA